MRGALRPPCFAFPERPGGSASSSTAAADAQPHFTAAVVAAEGLGCGSEGGRRPHPCLAQLLCSQSAILRSCGDLEQARGTANRALEVAFDSQVSHVLHEHGAPNGDPAFNDRVTNSHGLRAWRSRPRRCGGWSSPTPGFPRMSSQMTRPPHFSGTHHPLARLTVLNLTRASASPKDLDPAWPSPPPKGAPGS